MNQMASNFPLPVVAMTPLTAMAVTLILLFIAGKLAIAIMQEKQDRRRDASRQRGRTRPTHDDDKNAPNISRQNDRDPPPSDAP